MNFSLLPFALAMSVSAPAVAATVVTFDDLAGDFDPPPIYTEGGVSVSGAPAYYDTPGVVHLDDAGTSLTSSILIYTGRLFAAIGLDVIGLGQESYIIGGDGDPLSVAHDNVLFQGYRAGAQVAELRFSTGLEPGTTWLALGAGFGQIDALRISAVTQLPDGTFCAGVPCGHFEIDNVTIAPVPLPAAGLLLTAALGGVAAARSRRPQA